MKKNRRERMKEKNQHFGIWSNPISFFLLFIF
jgi:hypothetical protein